MKNILTLILCLSFCGCSLCQSKSGSTYSAIITQDTTEIDGYVVEIDNYKATRLGEACSKGDLVGVKKLLNDGADKEHCLSDDLYEYDIVYAAVYFNKVDILKFLITQKEDVNKVYNENGLTALSLACINSNSEIALLLLDVGANPNGAGNCGGDYTFYPIIEATQRNDIQTVKALLKHNVDRNVTDQDGSTPLQIAKSNNYDSLVTLLGKVNP